MSEQKRLFDLGRDEDGNIIDSSKVVTFARPGSSLHQFGLAVDSAFCGNDPYLDRHPEKYRIWDEFCRFAKAHGLESGIDFPNPDRPHCQMRLGMSLKHIQDIYNHGGLLGVWKKVDELLKMN